MERWLQFVLRMFDQWPLWVRVLTLLMCGLAVWKVAMALRYFYRWLKYGNPDDIGLDKNEPPL